MKIGILENYSRMEFFKNEFENQKFGKLFENRSFENWNFGKLLKMGVLKFEILKNYLKIKI